MIVSQEYQEKGGGIAIIHKTNLSLKCTTDAHRFISFEHIQCRLVTNSLVVDILILYRPPPSKKNKLPTSMFTREFQDYLSQLTLSNNQIIIAGDINISWNDKNCSDTAKLKDTLDMLNQTQLVSQRTHILGNTLDWIRTRKTSCIHELNVSTLLSDHFAVHCSVLTKKPPITKSVITYRKYYKLIGQESLNADVLNSSLFPEPPNSDVDDLVKHYNTVMGELMDKHAHKTAGNTA